MDLVEFPGGYGEGSSMVAYWIEKNMELDEAEAKLKITNQVPESAAA